MPDAQRTKPARSKADPVATELALLRGEVMALRATLTSITQASITEQANLLSALSRASRRLIEPTEAALDDLTGKLARECSEYVGAQVCERMENVVEVLAPLVLQVLAAAGVQVPGAATEGAPGE